MPRELQTPDDSAESLDIAGKKIKVGDLVIVAHRGRLKKGTVTHYTSSSICIDYGEGWKRFILKRSSQHLIYVL